MEIILTVKEESMIAVADAVREKSGSTESLSFPNGMVAAINSIETGGSNIAIDNKTIIEEDGVIRTAVGGYYADPVPTETLYENKCATSLTYAHHENLNCWFDGYFALPNWSPIGEEYYGKTFRLTWYETPYSNSPDYVIECFADGWFLDENLQTIMVENRENGEMVAGSIDNNTGYLSCMPHIYENPSDWEESYISDFRIEIPGSENGAVPIGSEFIPQEVWEGISNANLESSNAYSRADEAHGRIDYLEQNGGGSANIDNLTIITDEYGQIRTSIGGGITTTQTSDNLYYLWNWNLTFDLSEDGTSGSYQLPSWTPLGNEWIDRELHFIVQEYNPDTDEYYDYDGMGYFDGSNIYINDFALSTGNNVIDNATGRIDCYDVTIPYQITRFVFEVYVENISYIPIDVHVIPIDYDTITVQAGRLVAAGVSEDRVNELINEALGVIEDGYY